MHYFSNVHQDIEGLGVPASSKVQNEKRFE